MTPGLAGGFASTGIRAHPGHPDQKSHGRKGSGSFDERVAAAASGDEAVRAAATGPLDAEAAEAVGDYGSIYFRDLNATLRQNAGEIPASEHRWKTRVTSGVDRAMRENALDRDVVVRRGVKDIAATLAGREPIAGMEWVDHGFGSTTAGSQKFDTDRVGRGGAEMRILAPRGTRAISGPGLDRDEILLDRGLTYRAVRVSEPDDRGVRQIDVEIIQ